MAACRIPSPPTQAGSGPQALIVCEAVWRVSGALLSSLFFPRGCVCNPESKRNKILAVQVILEEEEVGEEGGRGWEVEIKRVGGK